VFEFQVPPFPALDDEDEDALRSREEFPLTTRAIFRKLAISTSLEKSNKQKIPENHPSCSGHELALSLDVDVAKQQTISCSGI
jgi:hypothetical protein